MRDLFREIWYGRPVVVLGLGSAVGTAIVAFTEVPMWVAVTIVAVNAASGFFQQQLTTPERLDKLHEGAEDELGPG